MPLPYDLPPFNLNKENPILHLDAISTGIYRLDLILEGGLKKGNSYLLYGSLDHIRILMLQLIDANENIKIIYLTTDFPYIKLLELGSKLYLNLNHCIFIDMYAKGTESQKVIYISPHETEKLKEIIKSFMLSLENKFVLIVDNLDGLKQLVDEQVLIELIKFFYVGIKDFNCVVIYLSQTDFFITHQAIDYTYQLNGSQIKSESLPCEINYRLEESGIEII
ncbi:MAG: ATPase domain-containing protein [Candidatus Aenigmatarchaeota archaeon]